MTNKADCKSGIHSLITIYKNRKGYDEEEVVRWCTNCGSVVVDIDYDNRVYPGKVAKMRCLDLRSVYRKEKGGK